MTTDEAPPVQLLEKLHATDVYTVYKGVDLRTQQTVTVKVIDLMDASDRLDEIRREVAVLTQCDCPYITKYYGSFMYDHKLWILLEHLNGGSLADLLRAAGPLSEDEIAIVMRDVLQALVYLHGQNRVHRDLKAANILVSTMGEVKLSDFGVSGDLTASMRRLNTFVGSPYWMAPEVIKQSEGYGVAADIWSLGITAIELATGNPPHADIPPMRVLLTIPRQPPPQLEGSYSRPFKEFVSLCLQADPAARPPARKLLEHRFIKGAKRNAVIAELVVRRAARALALAAAAGRGPVETELVELHPPSGGVTGPRPGSDGVDGWDFGTVRAASVAGTGGSAVDTGTVRGPSCSAGAAPAAAAAGVPASASPSSSSSSSSSSLAPVHAADTAGTAAAATAELVGTASVARGAETAPRIEPGSTAATATGPPASTPVDPVATALRWEAALALVPAELGAGADESLVHALRTVAAAVAAAESAVPGAARRIALALARAAAPEALEIGTAVGGVVPGTPVGAALLRRWRSMSGGT